MAPTIAIFLATLQCIYQVYVFEYNIPERLYLPILRRPNSRILRVHRACGRLIVLVTWKLVIPRGRNEIRWQNPRAIKVLYPCYSAHYFARYRLKCTKADLSPMFILAVDSWHGWDSSQNLKPKVRQSQSKSVYCRERTTLIANITDIDSFALRGLCWLQCHLRDTIVFRVIL